MEIYLLIEKIMNGTVTMEIITTGMKGETSLGECTPT